VEGVVVDQDLSFFQTFDMTIKDIRDKIRQLSEIAQKFDVLWRSQIFWGEPSKNCTHTFTPLSQHVVWKSFVMILPLAPNL